MKRSFLFAALPLFLPAAALAQTAPVPSSSTLATMASPGMAKLSMQDTHFIKMAAIAGMAEVNDGNIASQSGGTSAIKTIGTTMVTDHTKANNQLMAIAQQKGTMVPASVDPMHAATTAKLKMLSGSTFDTQYLHTELLGHEKTIALFKAEASTGSDPDLKSFASTTLPVLEHHLAMIKAAIG